LRGVETVLSRRRSSVAGVREAVFCSKDGSQLHLRSVNGFSAARKTSFLSIHEELFHEEGTTIQVRAKVNDGIVQKDLGRTFLFPVDLAGVTVVLLGVPGSSSVAVSERHFGFPCSVSMGSLNGEPT
jgi:hypothetical protein